MKRRSHDHQVRRRPAFDAARGRARQSDAVRRDSPSRQRYDAEITVGRRDRWLMWRRVPIFLAIVVILGVGLYMLRLSPDAIVRFSGYYYEETTGRTEQLPTDVWDQQAYKEMSNEFLRRSFLSRTKLTLRTSAFAEEFLESFPEVAAVELRLQALDDRPNVTVIPRTPRYLLEDGRANGDSLLVDKQGVAMARLSRQLDLDDLVIINDFVADDDELGTQVLPRETMAFIEGLLYQMAEQLAIDESAVILTLPALANELHLQLPNDDFIGKFDITKPVRQQAGAFIATRGKLSDDGMSPEEYIDVRVEGRAFYR